MSESDSDHDRAVELRAQIRAHNEAYHGRDVPTVPDSTYDELLRQLEEIETRRPDLTTADSPTRSVGNAPSELFSAVEHRVPMMSLDNAMNLDELNAWHERIIKSFGENETYGFVCELKFDGLAVSLLSLIHI